MRKFSKAYKGLSGPGSALRKRSFRLEWAEKRVLERTVFEKTKVEEVEQLHGEKGRYMAYDRIAVEEGGLSNPLACKRALNYVKACMDMGHPYVVYCSMKQSIEFLYFEKTQQNIYKKTWSLKQIQSAEQGPKQIQDKETPEKQTGKHLQKEIQKPTVLIEGTKRDEGKNENPISQPPLKKHKAVEENLGMPANPETGEKQLPAPTTPGGVELKTGKKGGGNAAARGSSGSKTGSKKADPTSPKVFCFRNAHT